jgi:hypothetical protein
MFLLTGNCQGRNGEHVVSTMVIDLDAPGLVSYQIVSFDQNVTRAPNTR